MFISIEQQQQKLLPTAKAFVFNSSLSCFYKDIVITYEKSFAQKFLVLLLLAGCQNVETGETLKTNNIEFIKSLGLLDKDERIVLYYSNFKKSLAGNFFTGKRIAHYWLDERDRAKNDTSFAFYSDIVSIDTVYNVPDFDAPYMKIKKRNGAEFRVYAGGGRKNVKRFFEEALKLWQSNKKDSSSIYVN